MLIYPFIFIITATQLECVAPFVRCIAGQSVGHTMWEVLHSLGCYKGRQHLPMTFSRPTTYCYHKSPSGCNLASSPQLLYMAKNIFKQYVGKTYSTEVD
ncbi:hypothetical protein QL285_034433 [Trifolium repens]|nr:hypothetical protein QL285_034433 [Trifolium repens]